MSMPSMGRPLPDLARLSLAADAEGFLYLIVDGVVYGKAKPGGNMVISAAIPIVLQTEAALGLLIVVDGWPDEDAIAREIAEFRRVVYADAPGVPRDAPDRRAASHRADLCERDREFLATFYDPERVREYVILLDRVAESAHVGLRTATQPPSSPLDAAQEVETAGGILIAHAASVAAESRLRHLSLSRAGGLPPVYARFLFALASERLGLSLPEAICRDEAGAWHADRILPREGRHEAAPPSRQSCTLGDLFLAALKSAQLICVRAAAPLTEAAAGKKPH